MRTTSEDPGPPPRRPGIVESAHRAVAHARSLVDLQRELARTELQQKGATMGAGAALAIAAGVLALFAVGFALATIAAALALVVDWWLALLTVFVLLVLAVIVLLLASRQLFRASTPLKPVQAIEEAQRTKDALRGFRGE